MKDKKTKRNVYTYIGKFNCCGNTIITVIIKEKASFVLLKRGYDRIIKTERKYVKRNRCKAA